MMSAIPSGDFNEGHNLRTQVAAVGHRGLDQGSAKRESGRLIDTSSLDDLESSSVSSSVDSSTGDLLGDPDHLSAFFSHAHRLSTHNIYQEDSHPSPPSKDSHNPFGLVPATPSNHNNQVPSSHHSPIRSDSTSMANHPSQTARMPLESQPDTKAMQTLQYAQQASQATVTQAIQYSHPTTTSFPPVYQHRSREQSRPSQTPQPMSPLPSLPPSAPPMTNRSRIESDQSLATGSGKTATTRPRRVSDGSTAANGALRKDMLLQRMAEALQIERAKSLVFQKELQNAEHEIDELASSLDELKRLHHKALYTLKREVSALKKERESLLEALEIAEGVEQHEAERYMALIDPTQAALMDDQTQGEPEIVEQAQEDDRPVELVDIGGGDETVRAQAQKRSAIRARRINDEISKLGPPGQADLDLGSSHSHRHSDGIDRERERDDRRRERGDRGERGERGDRREREKELDSERDGRDIRRIPVTTHRSRRLSKTRPSSRDGGGGGAFWRRSSSRNRDVEAPRTLGHNPSSSEFYDSGSLQNRGSASGGVGKIGKLFRKVFPIHGNNDQDWNGGDIDPHEEAVVDQFHHRVPITRERGGRSSNININGGGGATRMVGRMRSLSRSRA